MSRAILSVMQRQERLPIGLRLAQAARTASRAFDEALAQANGSLPAWLVLISIKRRQAASQRQLAEAAGIQGATLTHHLNALETACPTAGSAAWGNC